MNKIDDYPIGHIAVYEYNKKIPKGWEICDGRKTDLGLHTPDLRWREIIIEDGIVIAPQLFIIKIN